MNHSAPNPAPSLADLMTELKIRAKPGWAARLPPSIAGILTNKKGMPALSC